MVIITVQPDLTIPEEEFSYTASRSSGPGGQHVNTTSSRITLRFDVQNSPSLSDWQRAKILEKLAGYIDKEGVLAISCESQRSQHANRKEVLDRFIQLVQKALKKLPPRKATRPTLGSKNRRITAKKQRGSVKQMRGKVRDE
ncbi:alternative ribosome rescue aminoacyl-tRNA hydrolase ArfB [Desulfovibrio mangrovi]|uniref:alternative ribosome rescue aminoacyl-tRNA hydrolase ArfB n=1 Tax=Desulfovibrio mangrovi TaxID=2976983 RepID=UPI0022459456|nr:alternative ribosome rescue aminoacyl-tRNA hydrolase ArfB [Desulfovibrio mangrovi]UZP66585.1 alternative ribosome rescue aminoacyl-tRNA hydrolase ArfB [Desulfovibrio mangrovi]